MNNTKKYYRICERKNNKLYTLFHKVNEEFPARYMPYNVWLEADIKNVWDGS